MKISSAEEYALRAMSWIGRQPGADKAYSLSEVAEAEALPLPFLEQLFRELKRQGLVSSTRGAKGGYRLTRVPEQITVLSVIEAISGQVMLQDCESGKCGRDHAQCRLSPLWRQLEERIKETLAATTLADLGA